MIYAKPFRAGHVLVLLREIQLKGSKPTAPDFPQNPLKI